MGIALDRSKWRSVIFLSLTPFGLENIDPRSPKLLTLKFTGVPFHLPNLVTLALTEAEIAGRGRICPPPPSRARDSQTLSSARVNSNKKQGSKGQKCTIIFTDANDKSS